MKTPTIARIEFRIKIGEENANLRSKPDLSKDLKPIIKDLQKYAHKNLGKEGFNKDPYNGLLERTITLYKIQISRCEGKNRQVKDYAGDIRKILSEFKGMKKLLSMEEGKTKELANIGSRLRTLSIEDSFLKRCQARIRNVFTFGFMGLGRTTDEVCRRLTRSITNPYANTYAHGQKNYEGKLDKQNRAAFGQYLNEEQSSSNKQVLIGPQCQKIDIYPLEVFNDGKVIVGGELKDDRNVLLSPNKTYFGKTGENEGEAVFGDITRTRENGSIEKNAAFATTIGRKPKQEDEYCVANLKFHGHECPFLAVYDGHHGGQVSKYLKENLHERIEKNLKKNSEINEEVFLDTVIKSFHQVNEEIRREKSLRTAGATAICSIVYNDYVYTFNSGDGIGLLLNKKDDRFQILNEIARTPDERFEKSVARLGGKFSNPNKTRLKAPGATVGNLRGFGKNSVSGISVQPKVIKLPINENCVIYLSSDGPGENISRWTLGKKALELLNQEENSLEDVTVELLERAYESQSGDNLTMVMYSI